MDNKEKIDDIVAMLDNFVLNGGGHMNIQVPDPDHLEEVTVDTYNSTDCSTGNSACKIPNLQNEIDK